jgi:hypothetical protein
MEIVRPTQVHIHSGNVAEDPASESQMTKRGKQRNSKELTAIFTDSVSSDSYRCVHSIKSTNPDVNTLVFRATDTSIWIL